MARAAVGAAVLRQALDEKLDGLPDEVLVALQGDPALHREKVVEAPLLLDEGDVVGRRAVGVPGRTE